MTETSPFCFADELVVAMPSLRAFAVALSGNVTTANDLVQETLLKAWSHQNLFQPGTNFKAWLFTILRNTYYSQYRRSRREVLDTGKIADARCVSPNQPSHMDMIEFKKALLALPVDQREALILVGAEGYSYEEAASITGCAIGTVKSRVNRARVRLARTLEMVNVDELGADWSSRAVVGKFHG
jgi:RNA polymerase sigma-70 factor (ECF subfamily)